MNRKIKRGLFAFITAVAASTLVVTASAADTPKTGAGQNNDQATYPYGMPGGMMGQGYEGYRGMGPSNMPYGGYRGMGPGNMPYGGRGQGYMRQGYGGQGYGNYDMAMLQALKLSDAQRNDLYTLLRKERLARAVTMTSLLDLRDSLVIEFDKPHPDAKAIKQLSAQIEKLQQRIIERSIRLRNKIRGMLDKEQQETFDHILQANAGYAGMGMMNMMGYGGYGGMGMMNMMGYGGYGGWNGQQ